MVAYLEVSKEIADFQHPNGVEPKKKFWYIAHQSAAYSIPQILSTLAPSNRTKVTVRNSMEYRYLGLLAVEKTKVKDTSAGLAFSGDDGTNLQRIIDCQIAKFWLANPTNKRLKLDVYPLFVAGKLLITLSEISWDEYLSVVIWVQSHAEIEKALKLITAFRKLTSDERQKIVFETKSRVAAKDIGDQARRPWKLLSNHSLVKLDGSQRLKLATSIKEATIYLEALERAMPKSDDKYENFLTTPLNLPGVVISSSAAKAGLEFRDVFLKPRTVSELSQGIRGKKPTKIDYSAIQSARDKAGKMAEEYVLKTEIAHLENLGLRQLAEKVTRVSLVDDGLGFDILSFESDGTEKHIEVKSVSKFAGDCSIFISANEIRVAQSDPLWSVFVVMGNGSTKPYIWRSEQLGQAIKDLDVRATELANQIYVSAPQLELMFCVLDSSPLP